VYSVATTDLLLDVSGYYPDAAVFKPLTPARVLDTRAGLGAPKVRVSPGGTVDVAVLGRGGVPASGVKTVVLNVTAVSAAAAGFVTVYPGGQSRPTASNLNYAAGGTVPGLAMVKVGADGKVSLYTHAAADLVADVVAYVPAGSDYAELPAPTRLVDTRSGIGTPKARIRAGGTVTVTVANADGLPTDGISAAFLNITAVLPTRAGFLTVYPTGTTRPTASVVNYAAGGTRANSVLARLGDAGKVTIYSHADTDLIVDIAGYHTTPLQVTLTQPATTEVIPEEATQSLTAPTGLGTTGSVTTTAPVPAPGGYVYLPPGGANGDGVLGKVTSVETSGGATTADVVQVPFEEAFPTGHIEGTTAGSPPGITNGIGERGSGASTTEASPITLSCTEGLTAGVEVSAIVESRVNVLADWGPGKRTHVRVTNTAAMTLKGSVELSAGTVCAWNSPGVHLGVIGPFVATASAMVEVEVSGALSAEVSYSAYSTDGFDWWSGEDPTRLHSQSKSVTWTPPDAATANFKLSTGPGVKLALFGIVGPEVSAVAYSELAVDVDKTPWWTLSFGIDASAEVKLDIMFLVHAEYSLAAANVYSVQIARATGGYPGTAPLAITTTSLPPGTVDQPYSSQLRQSGGTGPYAWSRTSGTLPSGLTLSSGGTLTGTPNATGSGTVTVTVTDSAGNSAAKALAWAVAPAGAGTFTAISAGFGHTCALTSGGAAKCWGRNVSGQLGNGTLTSSSTPVQVSGLTSGVTAISARHSHTCALTSSGAAKCWGSNSYGMLGDGSFKGSPIPVQVNGLTAGVTAITAGDYHTCALTGGGATCWGYDVYGQLGNGGTNTNSSTPVPVNGLTSGVTAITTGSRHTCALTSGGAAKCWGRNFANTLGNGATTNSSVPVQVTGLSSGVTAISAGLEHTCALTIGGAATCWGYNAYGELGNGTTSNSLQPVQVTGLATGVSTITAGHYHTCARESSGGARCWGANGAGALGNGTTTKSSIPVLVVVP
jgi:hypothetical protein